MRLAALTLGLLMLVPGRAAGERQVKGYLGVAFAGETTFVDLESATGRPHLAMGASVLWLGDVFGLEGDVARVPGFFERRPRTLVAASAVWTVTGALVVALPRRLAEYGLRPYAVGGAGLLRVRVDDALGVFRIASNRPALVIGGGATGFVTDRIGVSWDLRYLRAVRGRDEGEGLSFGPPRLSFWRASMAVTLRN